MPETSPGKNPHAVALGRMGGSVGSPAQKAASRRNGKKSAGPPRKYLVELTGAERTHLWNIRQQGGQPRTPAQHAVVNKIRAAKPQGDDHDRQGRLGLTEHA